MLKINQFGDLNLAYLLGLYEDYLTDPESVGDELVTFFKSEEFQNLITIHSEETKVENPVTQSPLNVNSDFNIKLIEEDIRKNGHKYANLDPLEINSQKEYALNHNGSTEKLKKLYTDNIGYEFHHLDNKDEITWLQNTIENNQFVLTYDEQLLLLNRITEVDTFEEFLTKHFPAKKWFSIQGEDSLIPILDKIIELFHAYLSTRVLRTNLKRRN